MTNELFNEINKGYMLLVGVSETSTKVDAKKLAEKIVTASTFEDDDGKSNLSLKDVGAEKISVSQFTIYADVKKGNHPSFINAASEDYAKERYEYFNEELRSHGVNVKTGFFGEHMDVRLTNSGPITLIYEAKEGKIV